MGNVLSVTAKLFGVLRHSSPTPRVSLLSGNKRDPGKEERDGFKPSLRVALRGKNYSLHGKLVHKEEVSGSKVQKPCNVRTAEWCLPLNDLDEALAMVIQLAQDYASKHRQYSLLPIYVRLVKADDLFMSPASKFRPDGSISEKNCYIEVPFLPGAFGIDEFQDVVENSLFKKFKARPHWGKNNQLNKVKVEQCYNNDKLNKWKQVFQLFNKGGLLNNRFTHNV